MEIEDKTTMYEVRGEESEVEVLAPQAQTIDSATLALLNKSEIDQQITTAKKFPRNPTKVLATASMLVTQDADTAEECIYALPRGGKVIEGPSVRFAESMAYAWGNCRCGARVISEDEEFVTAMGSFFDMEANVHIGYEVKRRITDRHGKRYNSDMVGTTSNAACSIALRNAILRGIPKPIWRKVYAQARQVIAGDIKTLDVRRAQMVKAFEVMGAKRDQIFAKLDVKGIEDITQEHLVSLRGIYNAIREGDLSPERAFAPELAQDTGLAEKSKSNLERIKEQYAAPEVDPAKTQKLREEAERQKKAVAEKYGASQPPTPPPSEEGVAAPTAAAEPEAPPQTNLQEGGGGAPPAEQEPEVAGAASGPVQDDGQHGIPLAFDPPPSAAKSRKK